MMLFDDGWCLLSGVVKHCQALSSIVKHCQVLSSIVKSCQALSSIVKRCQALSSVVKHCQELSSVVKHCQALSSIVKHCQALSSIVKCHQESSSVIKHHQAYTPLAPNKCSRQMTNAGDFHLVLERCGDVSELFRMGDFGNIPKKHRIFPFVGPIKLFLQSKSLFCLRFGILGVILQTFLVWARN